MRTKDGQRLQGELVEETAGEVVLKTRYGVLVIPADAIEAIEGRPRAAAEAVKDAPATEPAVDLARTRALRLKARRLAQTGKAEAALATYAELLALDGDDVQAHADVCALRAQLGQPAEAVAALRRAVLAGFTDLEGLRRDPRLAKLQGDPGFVQLLDSRAGLLKLASRRAAARLARTLRARGAVATYREARDDPRRLVLLHAMDERAFEAARAELCAFVDEARRLVFTTAPEGPLYVVLVAPQDRPALGDAGYDLAGNVLTLALPFGALARAPGAQRELARALHAADQQARRQRHAPWLEEGLADLLGHAALADGELAPRHSPHLAAVAAVGSDFGGVLAMDRAAFDRAGRPARLAARYLLHHAWSRDALGRLYDAWTAAAEAGSTARVLQEVLGAPAADVEEAWRAWLARQTAPAQPFTGLVTAAASRGLRVTYVQPESGAARAHLVEADVVTALDGAPVRSEDDLSELLALRAVGQEVELSLLRGEEPLRVKLTLGARPPGPIGPVRDAAPYLGIAVEQAQAGVAVRSVDEGSPAAKAALRPGDLLLSLDGLEVPTVRAWLRALRQKQAGQRGALVVSRGGERVTVEVEFVPLAQ